MHTGSVPGAVETTRAVSRGMVILLRRSIRFQMMKAKFNGGGFAGRFDGLESGQIKGSKAG
jgi:hypothetical protein